MFSREYYESRIMRRWRISPEEWRAMHRWDRAYCKYTVLLDDHYKAQAYEDAKRQAEEDVKRQREFTNSLPKTR